MTVLKSLSAILAVSTVLSIASPALATREYENTIDVSASGRVVVMPDSVRNTFSVRTQAKTMAEAKDLNAKKINAITAKMKALGIAGLELETEGFSANPTYKYEKSGKSSITGYEVYHSMSIKVEHLANKDKLESVAAKITDEPANAGATNVGSVSFYLSDNNPAFDEATTLAVKRARQKADVLANAAGVKVMGIYQITNNSMATPMTNVMAAPGVRGGMLAMEEGRVDTPIVAGPMDVTATVHIYYDLAD
jgi:uncharacterized protein